MAIGENEGATDRLRAVTEALEEIVAVVRESSVEVRTISTSAARIAADSRRVLESMDDVARDAGGARTGKDLVSVSDANAMAAEAAAASLEVVRSDARLSL